jgi:membrane protein involved in colicin uptake
MKLSNEQKDALALPLYILGIVISILIWSSIPEMVQAMFGG